MANFALIFTNRSQTETSLALLLRPNRMLWAILVGTVGVLALVVYLPGLRSMFSFGPLHRDDLAVCLLAGVGTFIAMAIVKRGMVRKRRS